MKLTSSEPFWLVKNGIVNSNPPSLRENLDTEILIVVGGIMGSLIAHQCMEDGHKTVLMDRREIRHGSTSAKTSMLQYEIDVPLHHLIDFIGKKATIESYWACYKSIDDLKKIVQQVKSDCGFKKKESLYFAAVKKDVGWLKKEFEVQKKMKCL
ncbi:FAD-dependent oxidoreductase [Flavobacterium sp. DSR2-3-3]|uniref:FAD-dependent oxidoreductase n=1 Tax=Flavobacterium sp. DSR2-3-3 TaxID=2804632 RepID=UPI003CF1660C